MTRSSTRKETHTIQTWPGGASFEYRGDPDGPANQKSLRAGHYQARLRCAGDCRRTWVEDGQLYLQGSAAPLSSVFVDVCDDPRAGKHCVGDPLNYPERVSLCQLCKGEGWTDNPKRNPWRKGTDEEWRTIRIALRAELYARNYIQACASALVDDLIKAASSGELSGDLAEGFGYDAIRGLYKNPSDWTAEQCRDYIRDYSSDYPDPDPWSMDREALAEALTDVGIEVRDDETIETLREAVIANLDDETIAGLDEWRDVCRDHAQDNPAEVYEWWAVDSWLCEQLHAIGEVTIDNGYGQWWGRTCTGQGLIMDGTLQQIAARFER